jgi:hypothetical protein
MTIKVGVIGGGFYGLWISTQLIKSNIEVTIIEKNSSLMAEASSLNQGRIHNGHHYPRSISTFESSNRNAPKFSSEFLNAVTNCLNPLYFISVDSKVNNFKFKRLCKILNSSLEEIPKSLSQIKILNSTEKGWKVKETYFDPKVLLKIILKNLEGGNIKFKMKSKVIKVREHLNGIEVTRRDSGTVVKELYDAVIVATYGNIDFLDRVDLKIPKLKYQLTEIVNIEVPKLIQDCSITIIDGPFWSLTPWPAFGNHALTHVRYSILGTFNSYQEALDFQKLNAGKSNFELMFKDMIKYNKIFSKIKKIKSFTAIKCLLSSADYNDSRPIVCSFNKKGNLLLTVGAKIDNIYDLIASINKFKSNIGATNR